MIRSLWNSWKMWLLALPLALAAVGQAGAVPGKGQGVIFVADGSASHGTVSDRIGQLVTNAQLPLTVRQVQWSTQSLPTDFQSQYNFMVKSRHLAHQIMEVRKTCPTAKIYLVGFGAGTTVILRAAECLPPNTVNHIILLASTVSCSYDLRPALAASCEGIDSFYTPSDDMLRFAVHDFGTTDGGKRGSSQAAGLVCFHQVGQTPADTAIYARLRQHRLVRFKDQDLSGGHHGYLHMKFLRSQVISIIETSLINPAVYTRVMPYTMPMPVPPPAPSPPPPLPPPSLPPPAPPAPPPAPAPKYPVPSYPVPSYPTPPPSYYPAPKTPAPKTPAPTPPPPQLPPPNPPAPQLPPPSPPAPQTPAPQYPSIPLPQSSAPQSPLPPRPSVFQQYPVR